LKVKINKMELYFFKGFLRKFNLLLFFSLCFLCDKDFNFKLFFGFSKDLLLNKLFSSISSKKVKELIDSFLFLFFE
jgi:hypothetical protein